MPPISEIEEQQENHRPSSTETYSTFKNNTLASNLPSFKQSNKKPNKISKDEIDQTDIKLVLNHRCQKYTIHAKNSQLKQYPESGLTSKESAYFQQNLRHSTRASIFSSFDGEERQCSLIQQNNTLLLCFHIFFSLILLMNIWKNSFEIAFGALGQRWGMEVFTLLIYLSHVIIQVNSQSKNSQFEPLTSRVDVLAAYVRKTAFLDVVSVLVLILQLSLVLDEEYWFTCLLRLASMVSILKLITLSYVIENSICTTAKRQTIVSMLKLSVKILFLMHGLAIVLGLLYTIQKHYGIDQTWMEKSGITFENTLELYLIAWYWGATILSTVGFGDITPANNNERFFISLLQITCCLMFGFFVNIIGVMMKVWSESEESHDKEMRYLNKYLSWSKYGNELTSEVKHHFYNRQKAEKIHNPEEEDRILSKVSQPLRNRMLQVNNLAIIKTCRQLSSLSEECLKQLALKLNKIVLIPEQTLFNSKTSERNQSLYKNKLYVLEKGEANEYTQAMMSQGIQNKNTQHNCIQLLDSFNSQTISRNVIGWYNFVTQNKYTSCVKAKIFTVAYELQYSLFLEVLSRSKKQDFLKYRDVKDRAMLKGAKQRRKCLSCLKIGHMVDDCPRLHYVYWAQKEKQLLQDGQDGDLKEEVKSKKKRYNRSKRKIHWKKGYDEDFILQNQSAILEKCEHQYKMTNSHDNHNVNISSLGNQNNSRIKIHIHQDERALEWLGFSQIGGLTRNCSKQSDYSMKLYQQQTDRVDLAENGAYMEQSQIKNVLNAYKHFLISKNKGIKMRKPYRGKATLPNE